MQSANWSNVKKSQQELFIWQARGLMPKTLDMLAQKGQFHLSSELQAKLASRGFTDIISRSANGEWELPICQNIHSSLMYSLESFTMLLETVWGASEKVGICNLNMVLSIVLTVISSSHITLTKCTWFLNKFLVTIFIICLMKERQSKILSTTSFKHFCVWKRVSGQGGRGCRWIVELWLNC